MRTSRLNSPLFSATALLTCAASSHGATLIEDNFDNLLSGQNLHNRTPSTSLAGGPWTTVAADTRLTGDGSGGVTVIYGTSRSFSIDLGSNDYFTTNPGIYELSIDITAPPAQASESWFLLGLSSATTVNASQSGAHVSNASGPFFIYRLNGDVEVFAGPANTNSLTNTGSNPSLSAVTNTLHTFTIRLDTTAPAWAFQILLDGDAVDLGSTGNTTYTYAPGDNPDLRHLMLSTGGGAVTSPTATIDNFRFALIPEPSSTLLAGFSSIGLLFGLRRRI